MKISTFALFTTTALAAPTVKILNGTIQGAHLDTYDQDVFLGIPFAQPPLGSLRFAPPVPYNQTWNYTKVFDQYGDACIATGGTDNSIHPQSEDCLTLNVIRPSGYEDEELPVGIWIYGGGFTDGTSRRSAYNLSYIVENSVEIGKPIIGISLNYRLGGFGWLGSQELANKSWTNVGLRDQIQAINWIHENIANFGGDPNHLVLWGESAGAISVSKLLSSGKLDEHVIKGAIIESGPVVFPNITSGTVAFRQNDFDNIVDYFNCSEAVDSLICLQSVDSSSLQYVFNSSNGIFSSDSYPYIDGDIIHKAGYQSLIDEEFLKIPVLIGTNTDEGTLFIVPGLNTTIGFMLFLKAALPSLTLDSILKFHLLYPFGDPLVSAPLEPTYNSSPIVVPPEAGLQFPRLSTLVGDVIFNAGSRIASRFYSEHSPVYKYRFNIQDLEYSIQQSYFGAGHYQEVVYVFDNDQAPGNPLYGLTWNSNLKSAQIAKTMSSMWVSFISDLDPNFNQTNDSDIPYWPEYSQGAENYVFDLNGFYVENDDYRSEQMEFIESIISQLNA